MMIGAVLSLQIPSGNSQLITITMVSDRESLLTFKRNALARYEWALVTAHTATERVFRQSQWEHMNRVLDSLIPEPIDKEGESV